MYPVPSSRFAREYTTNAAEWLQIRHCSITTDEAAHLMLRQHRLATELRLAGMSMRFMLRNKAIH